uniref:Uncharacterized protein n=1 Tax=Arundo donax TaxID=35708 RepID=A0A0A9CPW5_ARUDO
MSLSTNSAVLFSSQHPNSSLNNSAMPPQLLYLMFLHFFTTTFQTALRRIPANANHLINILLDQNFISYIYTKFTSTTDIDTFLGQIDINTIFMAC